MGCSSRDGRIGLYVAFLSVYMTVGEVGSRLFLKSYVSGVADYSVGGGAVCLW